MRLLLVLIPFVLCPSVSRADLILFVQDAVIPVGGFGYVDILIESDGSDLISTFGYELQISNVGAPTSTLRFSEVGLQDSLDGGDLNQYVLGFDTTGAIGTSLNAPRQDFLGGDSALDFDLNSVDVPLSVADGQKLLARVRLDHELAMGVDPVTALSDTFEISILDLGSTEFLDKDFVLQDFTINRVGSITLSSAAAVPEPSSFALIGLGLAAFVVRKRRASAKH